MRRKRPRASRLRLAAKQVGLAQYRKDQWDRWLAVADDRDQLEETYEEWQEYAEGMAKRLRRAGLEVIWVDLELDEFTAWCQSRGYRNDGESRSRWAAERIGNMLDPSKAPGTGNA